MRGEKMQHNELNLQTGDGLHIYAQEWVPDGDPKGVVCLVHGLGEHSGRYAHLGEYLATNAFVLNTFDLRGHGKSEGQRGHSPSLEVIYDDFTLFLEHARDLHPNQPLFLYGHSLGGMLVLNYAIREAPSLNAIISTSPILRPAFEPPAWKITLGRLMYRIMPTLAMSNELDREALSRDHEVVDAYNADPLVHDRISSRLAIDMLDGGLLLLDNAQQLRIPTLLVHGVEDRICSAPASQEFAQKAGDICTLKLWEGLYHETHNEPEKEDVVKFTLAWINEQLNS
jgi:alpha-beta hydrolase superfamily lysophospholipase